MFDVGHNHRPTTVGFILVNETTYRTWNYKGAWSEDLKGIVEENLISQISHHVT